MVKKRGGRRKKATTPGDHPPEEQEATPSTSQPPPLEKTQPVVPAQEQPKSAWSQGPPIRQQEKEATPPQRTEEARPRREQAWVERAPQGRGRGRGEPAQWRQEGRPGQGRGRGAPQNRSGDVAVPRRPDQVQAWKGGEGTSQARSGGVSEPGWAGARRKEETRGVATPVEGSTSPSGVAQSWGGARPRTAETGEISRQVEMLEVGESTDLVPVTPGTKGREIKIETNHVRLNLGDLKTAYRYDVSIEPEKKPKRMLREAMELFRKTYFPNNHPSYDGQKLLYSAKRLPLKDDTASGSVTIRVDRGGTEEFEVTIKLTGTLDLSPLHNLLQKKNIGQEEAFQCVEVVFRQAYTNSFINVGRRFYTRPIRNDYPLGSGAVMYLGGYQAAVKGYKPFLNVDVAHKAFTTATPVLDLIKQMFSTRNRPITDLRNYTLQGWQVEQMGDYLKGLKVHYEIPNHPSSKRLYKVNALAKPASTESFLHEGRTMTVEEFFNIKWHQRLNYSNLPTLWVGSDTKRICIPMEYCVLKEGQPLAGSRLIGSQTSQMIKYSATSTDERKKKILNVMDKAGHNTNPCIQEFGFSLGNKFELLKGRVLNPPTLEYSDGKVEPKKGTWWAKKFKKGATIDKWTVVGFGVHERLREDVNTLARMIQDYGRSSGMAFSKPEPFDFIDNKVQSLRSCLEKKKNYNLIIVIIPNNKDSYFMVKQVAELQIGCLTQCIKSDTLSPQKLNESTVRNILLKINSKMNGTNHILHNLDLITSEPCMIMGADVTHPSPQAKTIPSVVAVTASYDLTATKYNISVYLQVPRRTMSEMIQDLENITLAKLRVFSQNCKREPKRIYFFRDGVSDGEFDRVREVEIGAIKRACQRFRQGYKPKLTFLVVQKRHHTRFFPTDQDSTAVGDTYNRNVPVGTCVDTVITDPSIQNFYLMSHQSIKGVGRPTKYCTLYDENGLSNDDVEVLTFCLCHLYTRCNRSVSYPAPTYFAHLAADRAKGYLYKKSIDLENLDQKLVQIKSDFASRNPMFFS